jgi:hypothetical protein
MLAWVAVLLVKNQSMAKFEGAQRALTLCREHVSAWRSLSEADFGFEPVTGGLTNLLFKCTNRTPGANPRDVLLRIYAGWRSFVLFLWFACNARATYGAPKQPTSRTCAHACLMLPCSRSSPSATLHPICLQAPKFLFVTLQQAIHFTTSRPCSFGVFPEGRIEGFIEGKCLVTKQLYAADRSADIACRLATFHREVLPLRKTTDWCTRTISTCARPPSSVQALH